MEQSKLVELLNDMSLEEKENNLLVRQQKLQEKEEKMDKLL